MKYAKSDGWSRIKPWSMQNLMVEDAQKIEGCSKSDGWSCLKHWSSSKSNGSRSHKIWWIENIVKHWTTQNLMVEVAKPWSAQNLIWLKIINALTQNLMVEDYQNEEHDEVSENLEKSLKVA